MIVKTLMKQKRLSVNDGLRSAYNLLKNKPHVFGWGLGYKKLNETHGDWIKYLFDGKGRSRTLIAHRNSYKTTCLVVGVIRSIFLYPDKTIAIVRKTHTLASKTLLEIRKQLETDIAKILAKGLYGVNTIQSNDWGSTSFTVSFRKSIGREGNVEAIGLGASITGRHYSTIIADDFVDAEDRRSLKTRDNTKDYVQELSNVLKAGQDARICYVGTVWHQEDAFSNLPKGLRFPLHSIEIPEFTGRTEEDIMKDFNLTPAIFSINYLLEHAGSEDAYLRNIAIGERKDCGNEVAFIDPAFGGNSTTAISWVGRDSDGIFHVFGKVYTVPFNEIIPNIAKIHDQLRAGTLFIETNLDKGLSIPLFKQYIRRVIGHNETVNKHERIVSTLYHLRERIIIDKMSDEEYIKQVKNYEEDIIPSDAPDSLAGAIRMITEGASKGGLSQIRAHSTFRKYR